MSNAQAPWRRLRTLAERARQAGATRQRLEIQLSPDESMALAEVLEAALRMTNAMASRPEVDLSEPNQEELAYLVVVDLSDATGDYQIYTPEMIEERVEVREGDILIIHTGYHHFGWDQPFADEIRYMVQHPGPNRDFAVWAKEKKIKWIGVDCGSADHPMNTIIRDWMPRQAAEADRVFQEMYGATLAERFTPDKYQLMHIEMFPHHIIHAECIGGDIDLLANRRVTIGFFPWRFVDGESSIGHCVAMVDDEEYEVLMARKAELPKTRFGDGHDPTHVENVNRLTRRP
jgi:arylformamidase